MKVIYHKTAIDKLLDIRSEADRLGKKVDYVLLTHEEGEELRHLVDWRVVALHKKYFGDYPALYHTVEINFEEGCNYLNFVRDTRSVRLPVQPSTVMGLRIVVAPKELHPL